MKQVQDIAKKVEELKHELEQNVPPKLLDIAGEILSSGGHAILLDYSVKFRAFGITFGTAWGTINVSQRTGVHSPFPVKPVTLLNDRGIKLTIGTEGAQ